MTQNEIADSVRATVLDAYLAYVRAAGLSGEIEEQERDAHVIGALSAVCVVALSTINADREAIEHALTAALPKAMDDAAALVRPQ